jgi:hypothetical protein
MPRARRRQCPSRRLRARDESGLAEPRTALTNLEDRYSFGDLPDGTYTMTFTLPGFVETTRSDIVLPDAAESPLDVALLVVATMGVDNYRRTIDPDLGFARHPLMTATVQHLDGVATPQVWTR